MGREDVPSTLLLMMISHENENQFYQFLIFLIVYYLIDPDFITYNVPPHPSILQNCVIQSLYQSYTSEL